MSNLNIPRFPAYTNPTGNEYPVIAYNIHLFKKKGDPEDSKKPSSEAKTDVDEFLNNIKECGFNGTIWTPANITEEYYKNLISYYYQSSAALGLRTTLNIANSMPRVCQKTKVVDPGTNKTIPVDGISFGSPKGLNMEEYAKILNLNADEKNLWGYKIMDEPGFDSWAHIVAPPGTCDLPEAYRTYLKNPNGHVAMVTLVVATSATYLGQKMHDASPSHRVRYENYLEAIRKKLSPKALSMDIYPVIAKMPKSTTFYIKYDYYSLLEVIGEFSSKHDIPCWLYILSNQHSFYENSETAISLRATYPYITEGLLRFQAMTALAYGFQGIVFWTYGLPKGPANYSELYGKLDAPLDAAGKPTKVWYYCQSVNTEIKEFGAYFLGTKFQKALHVYGAVDNVIETNGSEFPETTNFEKKEEGNSEGNSEGDCITAECITKATAKGKGFVITYLTKDNEKYAAIVSHDYEDPQDIELTIPSAYNPVIYKYDFKYQKGSEYYYDSKEFTGPVSLEANSGTDVVIKETLPPGGLLLIKYTD